MALTGTRLPWKNADVDFYAATAILLTLGGWFVGAVFIGASGFVRRSPEVLLGAMIVPLLVVWILSRWVGSIKTATTSLPTRVLVGMHGARILGALYLVESGTGISETWAVPAATTSILIGVASIAVAFLAVPASEIYQKVILILWAVVAGLELLAMSIWAIVAAFADRSSMLSLTVMPMFMLPAFVTPLMIWSQLEITSRVWNGATN
jgi:hypothetical protein